MKTIVTEMIDMVFDLSGETPPPSYPFELWKELLRRLPQLAETKNVGVLPLRLPANSDGMLLQKRAKLILRVPGNIADEAVGSLAEQPITVEGRQLRLGKAMKRTIQSYPTIHAQMVEGASDEVLFMDDINAQLEALGVSGNLICGKPGTLTNAQQSIHGFSLVIHDLKPDASLKLQYAGLGGSRQLGCGIFIPYKVISGLSDD